MAGRYTSLLISDVSINALMHRFLLKVAESGAIVYLMGDLNIVLFK